MVYWSVGPFVYRLLVKWRVIRIFFHLHKSVVSYGPYRDAKIELSLVGNARHLHQCDLYSYSYGIGGLLVYWSFGLLVYWSIGLLVYLYNACHDKHNNSKSTK